MVAGLSVSAQEGGCLFSGKVVDAEGKGLAGVSVSIRRGKKGTTSDAQGDFVLREMPLGKHKVTFSSLDCKTKDTVIVFNGPLKSRVVLLCTDAKRKAVDRDE